VADPDVSDIFVNGCSGVWVDRGDGASLDRRISLTEDEVRELAEVLVSAAGRHVDEATPCADARLAGGIRVHVVLEPISTNGTLISIRLPRRAFPTVDGLSATGFFGDVPAALVDELVRGRENILVTGAAGSGKTTLLAALLAGADPTERIIAIEDVAELRVDHPHFVSLEARQANLEGRGDVGLVRLVREALRMRPDRLVVGECRGAEVRELLAALNTGHDGGGGTMHANSIDDVPARLEALAALAGMSPSALARQATSGINTVLHVERSASGRRLADIGRFRLGRRGRLAIERLLE